MKEKVTQLVSKEIEKLNVFVFDVFISNEENNNSLNIVLDSNEIIDLNKITEASRIINKILDEEKQLLEDIDVLDIYSREKGE